MFEADPDLEVLYTAYREELAAVLAELEPWWATLRERTPRKQLRLRWPCGLASHPRVLGVYQTHHRRVVEHLAGRRRGPVASANFLDDAAWGVEAEPDPETLIPVEPHRLLIDRLQVEAPELHAVMIYLLLSPLGEEPEPSPDVRSLRPDLDDPLGYRPARFLVDTIHGVERGRARLLAAPRDLEEPGAGAEPSPTKVNLATCSEVHAMAHAAYRRALEAALGEAETWWRTQLVAAELSGQRSPEEAKVQCFERHLCGPAANPKLIGVVRAFWRLCLEVNDMLPSDQAVPPAEFLLGWIDDEPRETWVQILSAMPYWPITLDAEGGWLP
ncbi:hypothetical protein PPSIR1_13785 [Plesiocystis pacifica SIR-1]|uniref:Uncharacterized protein n=1 Tax=Plesiocystis pacifica SIR-1 TaxID=391625 RepID=A6GK18_9BACT|nr:hypothetical protein [Plesiocystis pacifica]EDM73779.1 hypothetical protein PPSIR1_13785 [Plesiocystis pacifica SIR-1]